MSTIQFLAGWALRSSILILSGALLLRALRVKDPSIRLAAWTTILCGSLAIPVLTAVLPEVPFNVLPAANQPVEHPNVLPEIVPASSRSGRNETVVQHGDGVPERFDWSRAAAVVYILVALALLLRLCVGLAVSLRLLSSSLATGQTTEGIEIRESGRVKAPVTLGIARPSIVLPSGWRQWEGPKLDAVLAHERSHIRRLDPAVQVLSAIHRALLWYNPLSWFLHHRIVRVAEEASDDAALAATGDRALYAEVLLEFLQRGVGSVNVLGVPMARYGRPEQRIDRILDGTAISRGVTRWSVAAILTIGSPLMYVVAAAHPHSSQPAQAPPASRALPGETSSAPLIARTSAQPTGQAKSTAKPKAKPEAVPVYLSGLGQVLAFYTVTVRSRIDGQLIAVNYKEGDEVKAGQVLASIDPRPYQLELSKAQAQLGEDYSQLESAARNKNAIPKEQHDALVAQFEAKSMTDRVNVDNAKLQLSYAQITAPITGIAGLRLVDPGNMVRARDTGIMMIAQVQPIAVLFAIPEDQVQSVRARLREGANLPVEAWNRQNTARIATGRLAAVDNQADLDTGTVKLKAVFDNHDGALFPNQFVNVRLLVETPGKGPGA